MTTITETISTLPDAPSTSDPTNFDTEADAFVAALAGLVTDINTWAGQANTVAGEVNTAASATGDAADYAETAAAAANYQGAWSGLTGAATAGWTVGHNGIIWLLEANLADITAAEPGVSASWTALTGIQMVTRTSNTIITPVDVGKVFRVTTGGFSQTFQAVATLTAGFFCYYWNDSSAIVTLDPDASETINGATTLILSPGEYAFIWVASSALYALVGSRSAGDHVVEVHTGNGHGSTNTKIRRFSTTMTNTGSAITYADSAGNGASFTIAQAGNYAITYSEARTSSASRFGVTVNSAALTTNIESVAIATRKAYDYAVPEGACSCTIRLAVGDVVRAHTDGTPDETSNKVFFSIRKVSN